MTASSRSGDGEKHPAGEYSEAMARQPRSQGSGAWKNTLIVLLALACAVQGWFLYRNAPSAEQTSSPAEEERVSVVSIQVEPNSLRSLFIAFDRPLARDMESENPVEIPAEISPAIDGTWVWASPFMLRFDAAQPFRQATEYTIDLKPGAFLPEDLAFQEETSFLVTTGRFEAQRLDLTMEPAPQGGALVVIRGTVTFNAPVHPGSLLKHMTLKDPVRADQNVPLKLLTPWPTTFHQFVSEPVQKSAERRELTLTIDDGLSPEKSAATLNREMVRRIGVVLDPVLRVRDIAASSGDPSTLEIDFSTPVEPAAVSRIRVQPETSFHAMAHGTKLVLSGAFRPGQSYDLTLEEGLTAADGARLGETVTRRLRMPDLAPSVGFKDRGMFLSRSGLGNLAIETVNTRAVELSVDRVYRNNIFLLFSFYGHTVFREADYNDRLRHLLGDRLVETRVKVPLSKNKTAVSTLDLAALVDDLVGDADPGLYRISLRIPGQHRGVQKWVLVTDLGLVVKKTSPEAGGIDGGEMLVWAASFASLSSRSGVSLTLLSDQNQIIARGTTDRNGLWRLPRNRDAAPSRPFLLLARRGKDFSFLLFDRFQADDTGLDTGGTLPSARGYTAFLYGERDIYRPGETVRGAAILRDARLGTPRSLALRLAHKDPRGRVLSERVVRTEGEAMAAFAVPLLEQTLTGPHTLDLLAGEEIVGQYRFQVEEFVPDRLSVSIDPETPAKNRIAYTVSSRYLFGPPASNQPMESRVQLREAPFAPDDFGGYVFGDPERTFETMDLAAVEEVLDDNGRIDVTVDLPERLTPPAALSAVISARVSEPGGRGVTATRSVPVHAYPRYPGLKRLEETSLSPGQKVRLEYVVVSAAGQKTDSPGLSATFHQDRWQTVLKRIPSGEFAYESVRDSRLLQSLDLPAGTSTGSFEFTVPEYGSYRVTLTDPSTGAASQVNFHAGGWGYSPWAVENPARLEIIPDHDSYTTGQNARVQIRTPFAGRLLVTVESDTIHTIGIHTIKGNTAEITLPIRADYAPNVYVSAVLVRRADDLGPGAVARAFGAAPIFVNRDAGRLPLSVEAPAAILPGKAMTVTARTAPGASLTLAAVDEGILQLVSQKTPDPFETFYAKRRLAMETFDIFTLLLPETPTAKTETTGGDAFLEKLAAFVRTEPVRREKPVAFWSGVLTADKDGLASTTVEIPEFQGAVRVMAVAARGRAFGSADRITRVRSPLVLTPTWPRFMAPRETVLVPVALRNDTGKPGPFQLRLHLEGPVEVEESEMTLDVAPGEEELVHFVLHTQGEPGTAAISLTAEGGGEKRELRAEIAVRPALPAVPAVASGTLDEPVMTFSTPDSVQMMPDTVTRDIRIGRLPMVRFADRLESLLGYPYGCLEQTVSRAFPLLRFEDLALALTPERFDAYSPPAMVQQALIRVRSMQVHDGGFSLWPGGREPDPWASIYATHFLVEARTAGFAVDDHVLARALDYTLEIGRGATKESSALPEEGAGRVKRRIYALYATALAGRADPGTMTLVKNSGPLPSDARAMLAAAFLAAGDPASSKELLEAPLEAPDPPRETGRNYDSPLRSRALLLAMLLEAAPGHPALEDTAKTVIRFLEAGPATTQESAFAFMALGRYFQDRLSRAEFSGRVYAGDKLLAEFSSRGVLSLTSIRDAGRLRIEMDPGYEAGAAHYTVTTRGVPTESSYAPVTRQLELRREFLTREGEPLVGDLVPQGALVVMRLAVRSTTGPVSNVVLQGLLPTGLEVENPRLASTEKLAWMEEAVMEPAHLDLRDDRVLVFVDLPDDQWRTHYVLTRAVTPGSFSLPPVQAEAMYDPTIRAATAPGQLNVEVSR